MTAIREHSHYSAVEAVVLPACPHCTCYWAAAVASAGAAVGASPVAEDQALVGDALRGFFNNYSGS